MAPLIVTNLGPGGNAMVDEGIIVGIAMDYGGSTSVSVVLVHGGFLGPWSWSDVVGLLEQQSISVYVPELPSMGSASGAMPFGDFYADAAAVREVLDGLRAPVLVCGHSYGGAVITEAAGGPHPAVAHLVYLTAAVPDINQSMASLAPATDTDTEASAAADEAVSEGPVPGPSGSIMLESDQAVAALFHDCSEARARQAAGLLRPMNPAVGAQTLTRAAWRDVPSTFVRGDQDRMPELVANAFFDRNPDIITLPTGHCPNWSRPDLVAELIVRRAEAIASL